MKNASLLAVALLVGLFATPASAQVTRGSFAIHSAAPDVCTGGDQITITGPYNATREFWDVSGSPGTPVQIAVSGWIPPGSFYITRVGVTHSVWNAPAGESYAVPGLWTGTPGNWDWLTTEVAGTGSVFVNYDTADNPPIFLDYSGGYSNAPHINVHTICPAGGDHTTALTVWWKL